MKLYSYTSYTVILIYSNVRNIFCTKEGALTI